jgi:hypothetical protein
VDFPDVAVSLHNPGMACKRAGEIQKTIGYIEKIFLL